MAEKESKNPHPNYFPINGNVIKRRSYIYNIVEAIFFSVVANGIISLIPFTKIVHSVSSAVITIAIFYFCIIFSRGQTITELLVFEIKYRRNRRILHLRGVEYEREPATFGTGDEDLSAFEKAAKAARKRIDTFIRNNYEEEPGEGA